MFRRPKKADYEAVVKPGNMGRRLSLALLITLVVSAVAYYFMLPPLNFHSYDFYMFIGLILVVYLLAFSLCCGGRFRPEYKEYTRLKSRIVYLLIGVMIIVVAIGALTGATLLRAKTYTTLMTVQSSDFTEDFQEISFSEAPRLDAESTKTLADNKLNELSQYVSQFHVSSTSTQINYNGQATRVAPLEYGDFFKWFNNRSNGLPAYMRIDMVTMEVFVEELDEGIKYSPSELFNRKLERHLRFQYPTYIFDTSNFEIDDEGNPYWITAVLTKRIGLFGGTDAKGAVITNAQTGESTYYEMGEIPSWVDKVFSDSLLLEQYNYYGRFQNGFINSIIGQRDVRTTSSGNGYIALEDDVWLYTGVTSASGDASNVGFILVNQRTKETHYYEIGGATESGAMQSAQGAIQNYGYSASFPILLNVSGEATYFMAMKDDAKIVKHYAMVNLKQRTVYGLGATPEECAEDYTAALLSNDIISEEDVHTEQAEEEEIIQTIQVSGTVDAILTQVIDGTTYYYFQIEDTLYRVSASQWEEAVSVKQGDNLTVEYETQDSAIIHVKSIKLT
ncbi:MAG: CvpA family protein [Clostridiales bacterium]|nr:CvpA family protein [Clostridiales bacterium]